MRDLYVSSAALTQEEERTLGPLARSGDVAAHDRMLSSVVRLIQSIAKGCSAGNEERDGMVQVGMIAAFQALMTFDPRKGRWAHHAGYRARMAMHRERRRNGTVQVPEAAWSFARKIRTSWEVLAAETGFAPSKEAVAARIGADVEEVGDCWDLAFGPAMLGTASLDAPVCDDGAAVGDDVGVAPAPCAEESAEDALDLAQGEAAVRTALRVHLRDPIMLEMVFLVGALGKTFYHAVDLLKIRGSEAREVYERGLAILRERLQVPAAA